MCACVCVCLDTRIARCCRSTTEVSQFYSYWLPPPPPPLLLLLLTLLLVDIDIFVVVCCCMRRMLFHLFSSPFTILRRGFCCWSCLSLSRLSVCPSIVCAHCRCVIHGKRRMFHSMFVARRSNGPRQLIVPDNRLMQIELRNRMLVNFGAQNRLWRMRPKTPKH